MGGAGRAGPLRWPLLGKGQAQARVRASGACHLVWHSEPSIHKLTQQLGIAVTLWVWHTTFALTSWPPVTAAADRFGKVRAQGWLEGGWEGTEMTERWVRGEDGVRGHEGGEMEVWEEKIKVTRGEIICFNTSVHPNYKFSLIPLVVYMMIVLFLFAKVLKISFSEISASVKSSWNKFSLWRSEHLNEIGWFWYYSTVFSLATNPNVFKS